MKSIFLIYLFTAICLSGFGQQITPNVINCNGSSFSNSSAKLAYSIGEIAITRIGNSNNSITQGFLQPKITATSVKETNSTYAFVAYPNPGNSNVKIKSDSYKEPITVKLIDVTGRELFNGKLIDNTLSLDAYENGIYQLLILNDKQQLLERKTLTKIN